MSTGYYLVDRPNPNYPQTRPRTAWGWTGPTGLVTVHTAEGALDRIAPDTGAENVAGFIATRTDPGGYHVLVDTDTTVDMAPDHLMTWHTAAYNLNGPGWGVSAACRSTEWDPDAGWTQAIIARMGAAIRAFWERNGHDPVTSARWLTHDQVRTAGGRIVGLIQHGVIQPADRSDAWALHPRRVELDQMLVDAIRGAAPTPITEDDMPAPKDWTADDWNAFRTNVVDKVNDATGSALTAHLGNPITGRSARQQLDAVVVNVDPVGAASPAGPGHGPAFLRTDVTAALAILTARNDGAGLDVDALAEQLAAAIAPELAQRFLDSFAARIAG